MSEHLSESSVKTLRISAISLGVLFLAAGILANGTGLSVSSGLSRNQIGFIAAGILLISAGIAGRRLPGAYKGTAMVLLNTVMAIALLELISIVAVKIVDNDRFTIRQRKMEEGHLDQVERLTLRSTYSPYVIWRVDPLITNDSCILDENGYRVTPGSPSDWTTTVMLFGGSAMWGNGNTDRETIPFHLQGTVLDRGHEQVRIRNMGQQAWATTQEVIDLMMLLRDGDIPDMVVFYDGFNDICPAFLYGSAGTHYEQHVVEALLNGVPPVPVLEDVGLKLLQNTNTWLLITSLREKFSTADREIVLQESYRDMGISTDSLAADIVRTYMGNTEIIRALSDAYGFECMFVIQPALWYGNKVPDEIEEEFLPGSSDFSIAADPAFRELFISTYDLLAEEALLRDDMFFYGNVFDHVQGNVFTDFCGAHITGRANAVIAESLYSDMVRLSPEVL